MITYEPATLPMKDAVDRIREQHIAAVNAGDAEAATNLFASDAVFLPPGQPALKGLAGIRGWMTHLFAHFHVQGFRLEPGGGESHGDVMIEHGSWSATLNAKQRAASVPAGGTYLTVYARLTNGDVRMIRDTFNGMP